MLRNRNQTTTYRSTSGKTGCVIQPDSILPVAVCAATFRNLNGREATTDELSVMTGIPAAALISLYWPVLSDSSENVMTPAV